jgi:RNA-binding protein
MDMEPTEPAPPPARRPARDLTGKQRSFLRGLAHHLDPVVQVGKEGLSAGVEAALAQALADHELVKVRVLESSPVDRSEAGAPLAQAAGAHVVGMVGRILILYRRSEEPVIELPKG